MMTQKINTRSLDEQREEYKQKRFLAMPIAGTIAWLIVGIAGATLSDDLKVWVLYGATGSIVYIGMFVSKFTGENFLDKSKPKNTFDNLFMQTVVMSLLVYAIAIPFFLADYTSLPLTVGILSGLMWIPLSWAIQHWVGIFHGVSRTLLITVVWYIFPEHRFVAIPAVIICLYLIVIAILENRWKNLKKTKS